MVPGNLDRDKLELYDITPDEVFSAVDRMDELSGAGIIQQDGLEKIVALRDPVNLMDIKRACITQRGDRSITLEMLGEVNPDFEDPIYLIRSNVCSRKYYCIIQKRGCRFDT